MFTDCSAIMVNIVFNRRSTVYCVSFLSCYIPDKFLDLVKFTSLTKEYERHDSEINKLNNELRRLSIPHMDIVRAPNTGIKP